MKSKRHILIALLMIYLHAPSLLSAQSNTSLNSILQQIQQAYQNKSFLSFQLQYLFANASRPGVYTDSLFGTMNVHGKNFRLSIDGISTIGVGDRLVRIDTSEKLIVLARATGYMTTQTPTVILESLLVPSENKKVTVTGTVDEQRILIRFSDDSKYKSIELVADAKTHYLKEIHYDIFTGPFIDATETPNQNYDREGNILLRFDQYSEKPFDESPLQFSYYVSKKGDEFIPAPLYSDYKIFAASPNL